MKLAIITINYNTAFETIEFLRSLKKQTDKDFNILVIDNASAKSDLNELHKFIEGSYPEVFLMKEAENLGFSGGNNKGIKEALKQGSEWLLLLNNDTWLENDFIARLRPFLSQKQGILGLPINEGPKTVFGGQIKWLKETLPHSKSYILSPKSYIIGGAIIIHKSVFDKVGYLDEKYFLYFEDADYSLRSKNKNIPIEILREPIVHHSVSASTKKLGSPKLLYYHYRNSLLFNMRHGPIIIKILTPIWSLCVALKQITKIAVGLKIEDSRYILLGIFDFYRGKFGKI